MPRFVVARRFAMPALLLIVAVRSQAAEPRRIGILAVPGAPLTFTDVTPEAWQAAFANAAPVRSGALVVEALTTPPQITAALTTRAKEFFAIVNPYGESFPCASADDARPMMLRIRDYCAGGGLWWETGGWVQCYAGYPNADGGWGQVNLNGEAPQALGVAGADWQDDLPPARLEITDSGRGWLGDAAADALARQSAVANRASAPGAGSVVLARCNSRPYLIGYRVGLGRLFRPGGFNPAAAVIVPAAVGVVAHLWTLQSEIATPLPGSAALRPHRPSRIGIIAPEPRQGLGFALDPDDLRDALGDSALVLCGGLEAVLLRTPEELDEALTTRGADYLAIVNPLGESFLTGGEDDIKPMLTRIKGYLEQGGLWWETAGYPFWYPLYAVKAEGKPTAWGHGNDGHDGLLGLGIDGKITAEADPPPRIVLTALGRDVLGPAWCELLKDERGDANRPPERRPGDLVLITAGDKPYVSAGRVGAGLLFQMGGTSPHPTVAFPCIMGSLRYLWTHPVPGDRP